MIPATSAQARTPGDARNSTGRRLPWASFWRLLVPTTLAGSWLRPLARAVATEFPERREAVPEDQPTVELVRRSSPRHGMMGLGRILQMDARLQPRPVFVCRSRSVRGVTCDCRWAEVISVQVFKCRIHG